MKRLEYINLLINDHTEQPLFSGTRVNRPTFLSNAIDWLAFLHNEYHLQFGEQFFLIVDTRSQHFFEILIACSIGGFIFTPLQPNQSPIKPINKKTAKLSALHAPPKTDDLPNSINQGDCNSPILSVLSSGTTGKPKQILHSCHSYFGAAKAFSHFIGTKPEQNHYHCWPINYYAGLFNLFACPFVSGGVISLGHSFEAHKLTQIINDLTSVPTDILYLSPTMLQLLIRMKPKHKELTTTLSETTIITTSSVLYPKIAQEFTTLFNKPLQTCYGITEVGGSFTYGSFSDGDFSVGAIMPEIEYRIVNDLLEVLSPYLSAGYLQENNEIMPVVQDLFFETNDVAAFENCRLSIIGRDSEIIRKGSTPLSLPDIENTILHHEAVMDCCAVPIKDEFWGMDYQIFYTAQAKASSTEQQSQEIHLFLRDKLPKNAWPKAITQIESIPRTYSGKALKRLLFTDSNGTTPHGTSDSLL